MGDTIIVQQAQPAWEMLVQVATALGTVGAAVYAGLAANAAARATNLEHQRREDERAAAKIAEVQVVRVFQPRADKASLQCFRLSNSGPHPARNIRLAFPDREPRNLEAVPQTLRPGQVIDVRYRHLPGAPNGDGATVHWTDGRPGDHSSPLPPGRLNLS